MLNIAFGKSIFSVNSFLEVDEDNCLIPIASYVNQVGLMEMDEFGGLMPIEGFLPDIFLELDIDNNIQPK